MEDKRPVIMALKKGTKMSAEAVRKGAESRKLYYKRHGAWNKGISHSQTTKDKISKSMLKYWAQTTSNIKARSIVNNNTE